MQICLCRCDTEELVRSLFRHCYLTSIPEHEKGDIAQCVRTHGLLGHREMHNKHQVLNTLLHGRSQAPLINVHSLYHGAWVQELVSGGNG
jgi:hypothetical protein